MSQKNTFLNEFPGDWRLFGEIELPVGAAIKDHIYIWLVETLRPLDLNDRFINKILASAELAALYDPTAAVEMPHGHMHVRIYVPEDNAPTGQTWGFFRVEKKGSPQSSEPNQDHAIVFYLYREGV